MTVSLKSLPDALRGAAWPPSARAVKCPVKSGNERDPHHMLQRILSRIQHSCETAGDKPGEGAGHGRSVWPECSGIHAAHNGRNKGMRLREEKLTP
jgi:hypothetical protein